jgi:hypothetical protein
MRRPLLAVLLAATAATGLAAPLAGESTAAAPGTTSMQTIDLPRTFGGPLANVKRRTRIPVLLPQRATLERPRGHRLEPTWSATARRWDLELGFGPRCGGANACFVGSFRAERGGVPAFTRTLRLRGGVTGYFKPTSCGGSCSPPEIQFVRRGVLYSIQFRSAGAGSERSRIVAMANAALAAGPR